MLLLLAREEDVFSELFSFESNSSSSSSSSAFVDVTSGVPECNKIVSEYQVSDDMSSQ